jgi:signal transduction histidine kinase
VQVFVNLLTNACDASHPGEEIEVRSARDGNFLRVEIVDRGSGIDAEHLPRVLEPFFTTKDPGAGTGLGLPLAYSIVQDHGGTLTVESEPGYGTRVIVRLPLLAAEPAREVHA